MFGYWFICLHREGARALKILAQSRVPIARPGGITYIISLSLYTYLCIHTYRYIHIYVHIYRHTYIHTYIYIYIYHDYDDHRPVRMPRAHRTKNPSESGLLGESGPFGENLSLLFKNMIESNPLESSSFGGNPHIRSKNTRESDPLESGLLASRVGRAAQE